MSRKTINETYSLQIPDTFESMRSDELQALSQGGGDPYQWGVRDRENHVMILALWKRHSAILAWMSDLKSIAKRNEQLTRKAYEGHGYRLLENNSLQAGNEKAEGYSFSYSVNGIAQVIQSFLIKDGKMVYAITCAGREENFAADQKMFRAVMESLQHF